MQKNACWVFETVRIISIIIRLICFTEKVYGSNPYSPTNIYVYVFFLDFRMDILCFLQYSFLFLISTCLQTRRSLVTQNRDKSITIDSFIENHRDRKRKKNFNQINRRKDPLSALNSILLEIKQDMSLNFPIMTATIFSIFRIPTFFEVYYYNIHYVKIYII